MWTKFQLFVAVLMVATGSINTISAKYADLVKAENSDGEKKHFIHPFVQALAMFIGEFLCYIAFKIAFCVYKKRGDGSEDNKELTQGTREFNVFLLLIPAMCDMTATSIMYIGLTITYASSFQMLRGFIIVCVAVFSIFFLHRKLNLWHWTGIFFIIFGLILVGVSDFLSKKEQDSHHEDYEIIVGDVLIIIAQFIQATQMVVEEKYVAGLDIPALQAVGWEGIFGFTVLLVLQLPFYFIIVGRPLADNPRGALEHVPDAFVQLYHSWELIAAITGTIISISFFNYAGITITKELSATTRMVLDSIRTIIIWIFSLAFFDQKFHWLQLLGFTLLLFGMCTYNNILFPNLFTRCWKTKCFTRKEPEESEQ